MWHILCQNKTLLRKVLPLHFWPKQCTELSPDSQINSFCKTIFFSELSIPQKAFPPILMTFTILFFHVVSNQRQLCKNKTLLYFIAMQAVPHPTTFSCQIQATEIFRDMKFLQKEEMPSPQSHRANGKAKESSCVATICLNHKVPLRGRDLFLQFPDLEQKHHHRGYCEE